MVDFVPFTSLLAGDNNTVYPANYAVLSGASGTVTVNSNIYVSSAGLVGIGIAAPLAKLDLGSATALNSVHAILARQFGGDNNFQLQVRSGSGTAIDTEFFKLGIGYTTSTENAYINFFRGPSSTGGFITFSTNTDIERMRIDTAGNVGIGVSTITAGYKLQVNGGFAATTKSFVISHPTKDGMTLRYGSLEGPENGVYVRGRLKGVSCIELPDYWTGLVDETTITVNLTAIGRVQNLYVSDIDDNRIWIGSESDASIHCFYTVFAERKDVPPLTVES